MSLLGYDTERFAWTTKPLQKNISLHCSCAILLFFAWRGLLNLYHREFHFKSWALLRLTWYTQEFFRKWPNLTLYCRLFSPEMELQSSSSEPSYQSFQKHKAWCFIMNLVSPVHPHVQPRLLAHHHLWTEPQIIWMGIFCACWKCMRSEISSFPFCPWACCVCKVGRMGQRFHLTYAASFVVGYTDLKPLCTALG